MLRWTLGQRARSSRAPTRLRGAAGAILLVTLWLGGCGAPGLTVEPQTPSSAHSAVDSAINATVEVRAAQTATAQAYPAGPSFSLGAAPAGAGQLIAVSQRGVVSLLTATGWSVPDTGVGTGCLGATAAFDAQGAAWIACVNSYTSTDGRSWRQPDELYGDTAVYVDGAGRLWSLGAEAVHVRGAAGWRTFKAPEAIGEKYFPTLAAAFGPDGAAFFAADAGPSLLVSFDGTSWKNYGADVGIPHSGPQALLYSRRGGLLAGAQGALYQLSDDRFVTVVSSDRFAAASGVSRFAEPIADLAETPDGQIWIATPAGLFAWDGLSLQRSGREDGLPSSQINDLALDAQGRLWVATAHGIATRTAGGWEIGVPSSSGLGDSALAALAVSGEPTLPAPDRTIKTTAISGRVIEHGAALTSTTVELCSELPILDLRAAQGSLCSDQFYSARATTDAQGGFRFANVPLGTYAVAVKTSAGRWVVPVSLDIPALKPDHEYVQNIGID